MANEFDDLDLTHLAVRGTVRFTLSLIKVHSDKPLVLEMRCAADAANPEYKSMQAQLVREFAAATQRQDADVLQALYIQLYAHTVIVGWENVLRKDGTVVPFSPAACIELLTKIDKVARDELVPAMNFARNPDNFRASPTAAAAMLGK